MSSADLIWITLSAGLVFLMQAGFLCLESGLTRAKNNINVAMKNLADFSITTIVFWGFGYAFMFGKSQGGWIGFSDFIPDYETRDYSFFAFLLFQLMFCGTSVTILSGATAERLHYAGYLLIAFIVSGLIYPVFGHWAWNGLTITPDNASDTRGWLRELGFVDFAGSSVVHSIGG